jgi:type I restriction enzyme S subunit
MWITPAEMGARSSPYVDTTLRRLSDMGLKSANLLPPNSVILSSRAPIGHLVINTVPMATNQGCKGLVPRAGLDHKYLYYYLTSIVTLLNELGTGATFKELSGARLKAVPMPVPPLAEQQRIVGILDDAFSGLASANAIAEKNLENAAELFDARLSSLFSFGEGQWPQTPLSAVCNLTVGHVGPMASRYKADGIPFLRSQNIKPFAIDLDGVAFIDDDFDRNLMKSRLTPGDVVIVRTGHPGTAAVVPDSLVAANCADLVIVRPSEAVDPHYIAAFFNSSYGKRLVDGNLVGAAQKHFNVTSAKSVRISLPPRAEQQELTGRIRRFREEITELADRYTRQVAGIGRLREQILSAAFSGKLSIAAIREAAE